MPEILPYQEVLNETEGEIRHLLLGNGFSIDCKADLFRYDRLFDRADFTGREHLRDVFRLLGTTNFETAIRALRSFSALIGIYVADSVSAHERSFADAEAIKEILVRSVADSHPNRPHEISDVEYRNCRNFLRPYKSINTLNYDLLLYWTLMKSELGDQRIRCDDGFRKPSDDHDAAYVSWDPDNANEQNVRFIHGALHLFDTGTEVQKYTWINTQVPLIEQIRGALANEFFPVYVSEGTCDEKLDRIRHNDYLNKVWRAFTSLRGSLVVFGHSLDENDDHIFIDRLGHHGKVRTMYVSILGDQNSPSNRRKILKAESIKDYRPRNRPLDVKFFDATTAHVWR
jgi:hypothetical protein